MGSLSDLGGAISDDWHNLSNAVSQGWKNNIKPLYSGGPNGMWGQAQAHLGRAGAVGSPSDLLSQPLGGQFSFFNAPFNGGLGMNASTKIGGGGVLGTNMGGSDPWASMSWYVQHPGDLISFIGGGDPYGAHRERVAAAQTQAQAMANYYRSVAGVGGLTGSVAAGAGSNQVQNYMQNFAGNEQAQANASNEQLLQLAILLGQVV